MHQQLLREHRELRGAAEGQAGSGGHPAVPGFPGGGHAAGQFRLPDVALELRGAGHGERLRRLHRAGRFTGEQGHQPAHLQPQLP